MAHHRSLYNDPLNNLQRGTGGRVRAPTHGSMHAPRSRDGGGGGGGGGVGGIGTNSGVSGYPASSTTPLLNPNRPSNQSRNSIVGTPSPTAHRTTPLLPTGTPSTQRSHNSTPPLPPLPSNLHIYTSQRTPGGASARSRPGYPQDEFSPSYKTQETERDEPSSGYEMRDVTKQLSDASSTERGKKLSNIRAHGGRVVNFTVVTEPSRNAIFLAILSVVMFLFILSLAGVSIAVIVGEANISFKAYGFTIAFVILFLISVSVAYAVFNIYRYDYDLSPWQKTRLATPYVLNLFFCVLYIIMITIYLRVDGTGIDRTNPSEYTALAAVMVIPVVVAIMNAREIVPTIMCALYQEGTLPGMFVVVVSNFDGIIRKTLRRAKIDPNRGDTYV